jgi:hypothetical protein
MACVGCKNELFISNLSIKSDNVPQFTEHRKCTLNDSKLLSVSGSVGNFSDFVQSQMHFISKYPEFVVQSAYNWPDNLGPSEAAKAQLSNNWRRPWIRWANKPKGIDNCLYTLKGHDSSIFCCAYSPDGI